MAHTIETEMARGARRSPTEAERRLWAKLRRHGVGWHFRRQYPVAPFVLDFACVVAKIVVEADGGQHAEPGEHDVQIGSWNSAAGLCCGSGTMTFWPISMVSSG